MCCFLSRIPEERLNGKPGQYANNNNANANAAAREGADDTTTPMYIANVGHDNETTGKLGGGTLGDDQKRREDGHQLEQYPMVNVREAPARV
ncbi:hypothetical protein FRC20_001057 [Serendipita sp. 405]|nr:hypothetical protein FRC20_001057 [Serendipita sp. 405]